MTYLGENILTIDGESKAYNSSRLQTNMFLDDLYNNRPLR